MVKRNVFLTYHHADQREVDGFVYCFRKSFNQIRVIGISGDDDFINSNNTEYILRRIREKYIAGTAVTIALIGKCTWARKYVDWEIAATLRNNPTDPRGGLLAVQLPSVNGRNNIKLPERLGRNRQYVNNSEVGYASYHPYPSKGYVLAQWVEGAIRRRDQKYPKSGSTSGLRKNNSPC